LARILMVIRPDAGGAFEHLARLSAQVARRGHDVLVCGPLDNRRGDLEVETIPLEISRPIAPPADLKAVASFARLVRRLRPDVVHAHGSKGAAVARIARATFPRTPLIHTPHGYPFAGYFESALERSAYRVVERSLAPLTTRVVCVCEAERRHAHSLGLDARARVVYNGIGAPESAATHPGLERIGSSGPIICAVSELRSGKGVETLLDAMPAVLARHPQVNLAVAGDGPLRASLEAQIEALGVAGAVHLLGQVSRAAEVLVGAELFVSPSWAESFPFSVLEAMSRELPIVATDVGGTGEAIQDGVTGRLVASRDTGALAAAISGLLDDEAKAKAMGAAARTRVGRNFTLTGMIDGALAVYDEVVR
jgi:glycosyltransferase involved in cell wall biosynthesis